MDKAEALDERDREIAARLLRFRELTRISRTALALSINIGGERLASYERARVRLKYLPVHRLMEQYKLSPLWLATGQGEPFLAYPFDDSEILHTLGKNALFTWVFDNLLRERLTHAASEAATNFQRLVNSVWDFVRQLKDPYFSKALSNHDLHRLLDAYERLAAELRKLLGIPDPVKNSLLTFTEQQVNPEDVKKRRSLVQELIAKVKDATEERGSRTRLAEFLGVTPQRLNDWLSGEHEPSAETTLRLLAWVSQQGENQKAPERVTSTPEGRKTQSRKTSSNENRRSGPKSPPP